MTTVHASFADSSLSRQRLDADRIDLKSSIDSAGLQRVGLKYRHEKDMTLAASFTVSRAAEAEA